MQNLWPFYDELKPHVVFVPGVVNTALEQNGNEDVPIFHFIVGYTRAIKGVPVLITQSMIQSRMKMRFQGGSEHHPFGMATLGESTFSDMVFQSTPLTLL